jgi:hypothetical protein
LLATRITHQPLSGALCFIYEESESLKPGQSLDHLWRIIAVVVSLCFGQHGLSSLQFSTNSAANAPLESSLATNQVNNGSSGQTSSSGITSWGRSQVGWLRFRSQGNTAAQSPIGSWGGQANTRAVGAWDDYVTVNAGIPLAGQPGRLTATIVIEGTLGLSGGDAYAGGPLANQAGTYFYIQAKWDGANGVYGASNSFVGGSQLRYVSGGGTAVTAWNGNLIGPGTWQVTFPITFGQQGSIAVNSYTLADARAVVYGPGDGLRLSESVRDFKGGIRWAGITEIRTTNGTLVTNFTVSAMSGFDYVAGVNPAPPQIDQINRVSQNISLQWTDSLARAYTVETTFVLPSANWTPVPGMTWPITTNWATFPAPSSSNAFFRVRAH